MVYYTQNQLTTMISEVDIAINACLLGKEYRLDTGQSSQMVKKQSLPELRAYRSELIAMLAELLNGNLTYNDAGW